jgi:hypothetical protein
MQRVLITLLAGHHDGETVSVSAVHAVARRHSVSSRQVTEILATMEIVAEDGPDLFSRWLDARPTGLAAGIAREARRWAVTLHDGGPRTAPRSPQHRTGLPARYGARAAGLVGPL